MSSLQELCANCVMSDAPGRSALGSPRTYHTRIPWQQTMSHPKVAQRYKADNNDKAFPRELYTMECHIYIYITDDVTIEPSLSLDDLSQLRLQWPVTVFRSMVWLQQDLDGMRAVAKRWFRNSRWGELFLLWEMDKVRYVQKCGDISFGFEPVVAVPSVLVHCVEVHAAGLHGSPPGAHDVPWGI